ncbi:phospholipase A1 member A-like [Cimex lectularius]|uniref:Lipase domain-containing protein n=1 Tax=Cimex lectularius TaxID=79782 RepID=A0A8I6SGU4_CIMLE|nr:phospholipase A1 member A-like [Cimex lectularius]
MILPLFFLIFTVAQTGGILGRDDSKFELQKGPCVVQYNEPCYSNKKIKFFLYTKSGQLKPQRINLRNSAQIEGYDSAVPFKVLIHGFSSTSFLEGVLSEYLLTNVSNVLLVDWQLLANRPCYLTAVVNTWQVGKCTAIAIHHLAPTGHIHIVGFSLGAHVAGYTSNFLNEHFGRKVNRITGLDPALPFFATPINELKLDPYDADFVDVIHTSMGVYGKLEPCGTQDFYVTRSPIQPGCANHTNPSLCSHWRAAQLFAESIRTKIGFLAKPCSNFWTYLSGYCTFDSSPNRTPMGEHVDLSASGVFIINTNDVSPYALG